MNDIKGIIEDVEKSSLVSDKVIKEVIEIIGQEKWQDINDEKSDICTTTGELVIILKRIPDLEKENAELKSIAQFQQSSNMKRHFEIQELEKKNKKLESDFRICEKNADTYYDQLTKATKLLNEFMRISKASDEDFEHDYSELIGETEQFIKGLEK